MLGGGLLILKAKTKENRFRKGELTPSNTGGAASVSGGGGQETCSPRGKRDRLGVFYALPGRGVYHCGGVGEAFPSRGA